ncbi:MAG: hypothetical protein SFV81_26915 [Pirellulaceae bacterium]|nr:hypothetical protein [Pirellulaceae bacterium]
MATHQQTVRTWPIVLYSLAIVALATHEIGFPALSEWLGYSLSSDIAYSFTVGGFCMLLILGGLGGRVCMQGAMAAIAIGVSFWIVADVRDYLVYYEPEKGGLLCVTGLGLRVPYVPALLFLGSSPFLLGRCLMGWRLTRNAHELYLPRRPFGVEQLLQITAVIACAVFLLKVPNEFYETEGEWGLDYFAWFVAWQLCGFSGLLLPIIYFAFGSTSPWRYAALIGFCPGVVFIYAYVVSGGRDPMNAMLASLAVTVGLVVLYCSGFRLARYAPKHTKFTSEADQELTNQLAVRALRNRQLNRYLVTGFVTVSMAVCLATGVLRSRRADIDAEHQRLRFELAERGGRLDFWMREAYRLQVDKLAGDDFLKTFGHYKTVRELSLEGSQISDAAIADLKQFSRLRSLNLNGTQITDACLDELCKLTQLSELKIGGTSITRHGRQRILRELVLFSLDVSDLGIDDEELNALPYGRLCDSGSLQLRNNPVTDAGVSRLLAASAKAEVNRLDLSGTLVTGTGLPACQVYQLVLGGAQVTDQSISQLLSKPVEGTFLILQNTSLTDAVLPQLLKATFACVEIGDCQVTEAGYAQEAFQTTSDWSVFGLTGKQFTGEFFQRWRWHVNSLNMQGSGVTDETLKSIANLRTISGLSLRDTSVSDAGIQHLKRLTEFSWLDVGNTQVTAAGLIAAQLKCRFINVASGQFTATELLALSARYVVGIDEPYAYY